MAKKKSTRKLLIFSILGVLVVGIAVWALVFGKHEDIVTVQTEKVERRTITQIVTATGKIQPEVHVNISPEVSGEIVELPIGAGEQVKKGQLLFRIKPDTYIAARDQSAASVNAAKSQLDQAHANVVKTDADLKRLNQLFEKKLASQADLDAAQAAYNVAIANEDASKHNVESSKALLQEAEETLKKTSVYAPMDGVITALSSQLGERVLGTQQFAGTVVLTISDLNSMVVSVDVDENDVVLVHKGDTVRIDVDAFPDKKFTGVVYAIANTAQTQAAGTQEEATNFEVDIRILDKGIEFRPGMSANATIETQTKYNILTVPLQSVTTRLDAGMGTSSNANGGDADVKTKGKDTSLGSHPPTVVFTVKNGISKLVKVKTGISSNSYVEILDGLSEGDEVVSGSFKAISKDLDDGKKVKVDNMAKSFNVSNSGK
ncbi:MAG TPA: efflux RND transporter periplasmic adaptor subunit [Candidatus Kapabacteria bacterium]|nr:efflux RND transporter periplasmic adaptor subunit [Candidatus Kapabacteria bacterium]